MILYIVNEYTMSGDYNGNSIAHFEKNHIVVAENEKEANKKALRKIKKEALEWVKEEDIDYYMEYGVSISLTKIPDKIDHYKIKLEKE